MTPSKSKRFFKPGDRTFVLSLSHAANGASRDGVSTEGPTAVVSKAGLGIHRYRTAQGDDCVAVNPSSMPKRSGDRIKTDRRDGEALAQLHRAGELTAIHIPTAGDEALRDPVRAREDAVGLCTQAKHRLKVRSILFAAL